MLPWLYGGTVAVVLALVLLKADLTKGWAAWLQAVVTIGVGLAAAAAVQFLLVPRLQARILTAGHLGEVSATPWQPATNVVLVLRGKSICLCALWCLHEVLTCRHLWWGFRLQPNLYISCTPCPNIEQP